MAEQEPPKAKRGRPKGIPKTGGRPKGSQNVITRELKEMILTALDDVGGVEYLKNQALDNPSSFMTLIGKVLPMTLHGSGDNGEQEVVIRWATNG